ncbi:MAG: thiamine phosphate synthase [bacterium]|nr:thiamine phosphate synthase [bacterium]
MDANLNRAREGIRVAEEVARFVLNSLPLSQELKKARHDIKRISEAFPGKTLLGVRESELDVGRSVKIEKEGRENWDDVVRANLGRAQEAIRVLEESSKISSPALAPQFEELRFRLYNIEKKLIRILTRGPLRIGGLYAILDDGVFKRDNILEAAGEMIAGGVQVIQLRGKSMTASERVKIGMALLRLTRPADIPLIINDDPATVAAISADGVHLGQDDMPLPLARKVLGHEYIIGCSTHSPAQAEQAQAEGADYIAVGPIYRTSTKPEAGEPVGVDLIRKIKKTVSLPLIAIGGICEENLAEVIEAGADGAAVISALAENTAVSARGLSNRINSVSRKDAEPQRSQ